jgi:hypothetical protein
MTTIDTTVKGRYTIENDRGEIIAEVDNAITDHGMKLLASHPIAITPSTTKQAFQYNMLYGLYIVPTTGSQISVNSDPLYSSKVTTLSDGRLQIDTIVKKRCVFTSSQTISTIITNDSTAGAFSTYRTSIAVLPTNLTFAAGEAINITYTLRYVTNCNQIISNMPFVTNVSAGILMPPNKTNVRNSPVVIYPESGTEQFVSGAWGAGGTHSFRACLDIGSYSTAWDDDYIARTFYAGTCLYFYSDVDIYDTMRSTTASSLIQPPGQYQSPTTLSNYIYKKSLSSAKYTVSGNTWSTSLRFLFGPGEWPTTAKGFSLLFGTTAGMVKPDSERGNAGIFTALQQPYNPYKTNAKMVVGIDYKFNWTRG